MRARTHIHTHTRASVLHKTCKRLIKKTKQKTHKQKLLIRRRSPMQSDAVETSLLRSSPHSPRYTDCKAAFSRPLLQTQSPFLLPRAGAGARGKLLKQIWKKDRHFGLPSLPLPLAGSAELSPLRVELCKSLDWPHSRRGKTEIEKDRALGENLTPLALRHPLQPPFFFFLFFLLRGQFTADLRRRIAVGAKQKAFWCSRGCLVNEFPAFHRNCL